MRIIYFLFATVLLFGACSKGVVEKQQEQLPKNVDTRYLISEQQAVNHVKMMMGTLNESTLTKGAATDDYAAKVITNYQSIPFTNLTKSGTSFRDSVRIPIYSIELTDAKSRQKATFMFIGDSRISNPFIAFSENEMFDLSEIPEFEAYFNNNLKSYIQESIHHEVILTKGGFLPPGFHHCNAGPRYKIEWEDFKGPLITKISWDQVIPENDSVPYCTLGVKMPAGCVAVAIAQILSYHKYPTSGSYTNTVSGKFITTTYDWNLMTSVYDPTNTSNTTIRSMIANIHAEIGTKVHMNYGCSGSGPMDMISNPDYYYFYNNGFSTAFLLSGSDLPTIMNEIDNNRPVYMTGAVPDSVGHAWVVDGYKNAVIEKGNIYYCYQDQYEFLGPVEFYDPDDFNIYYGTYYRCKLGWGPAYDTYYLAPLITAGGYNLTSSHRTVCNITR